MKYLVSIIAILAFQLSAFSQKDSLVLKPNFNSAKKQYFQMKHQWISVHNADTNKYYTTSTIQLKVVSQKDSITTLSWKQTNTEATGSKTGKDNITFEINKLLNNIEIVYQINTKGQMIKVTNGASIQKKLFKGIDKLVKEKSAPKWNKLKEIYSKQETVEFLSSADIDIFHALYTYQINFNDTLVYKTELSNPLGDKPFEGKMKIKGTAIKDDMEHFNIDMLLIIDKEKSSATIEKIQQELSKQNVKVDPNQKLYFDINSLMHYKINNYNHLVKDVNFQRFIITGNTIQVNNIEIKALDIK